MLTAAATRAPRSSTATIVASAERHLRRDDLEKMRPCVKLLCGNTARRCAFLRPHKRRSAGLDKNSQAPWGAAQAKDGEWMMTCMAWRLVANWKIPA